MAASRRSTRVLAIIRLPNLDFGLSLGLGAERVYWHTQEFNGAARSLYDSVGQLTSMVVYEREV